MAALPSLLASADQVGNVLHDVQMRPREVATSLASDVSIDPAKCASAVAPALASTYTGSGYTGVAVQGLMEASPGRHKVIQAVAAFSDEAAAQQFYTQQLSAWRGCRLTGVTVSFTNGQPDDHATITIISETDGIASTVLLPAGASEHQGSECERAMGVRRNVVVDVRACGQNTITTGASLARVINDNITRHS
ncbi:MULTISPECIES: sensor domain-containing protein [Mycobacterium]|uniref:sensor domain-containing protein n=1 Tax=Mycobacterium TaxID=1763 RepID=UPI0021008323|nr:MULTISPECIES: sensor domain-containing protein [Mycobacterium]